MIWAMRALSLLFAGVSAISLALPYQSLSVTGDDAVQRQIGVPARALEVVCPGSLYQLGGEDGTEVDSVQSLGDADFFLIRQGETTPFRASEPKTFIAEGQAQSSGELSGYQWQQIDQPRIAGLASLSCKKPVTEAWMVGGRTSLGSESLLIIHNPDVLSTILDLTFYVDQTRVSDSLSLAPAETKVVNLGRYASSDTAIGLSIESQGGRFAAWMQSKTNSGITPTGVDIEAHNQLQTNPSLIISAQAENLPQEFRIPEIYALSTKASSATVSVSSLEGGFGDAFRVELVDGVNQIELPNLLAGSYRITLEAESALLVARTVELLIPDFSLTQSEPPISGQLQIVSVLDGVVEVAGSSAGVAKLKITSGGVIQTSLIGEVSGQKTLSGSVSRGDLIEIEGENLLIRVAGGGSEYLPVDNSNLGSDLSITIR